MCKFLDVFHYDGRYQACSCNKHLWSTTSKRLLTYKPSVRQYLHSADGTRVLWDPQTMGDEDEEEEITTDSAFAPPPHPVPPSRKRTAATFLLQLLMLLVAWAFARNWPDLIDRRTWATYGGEIGSTTLLERMIELGRRLIPRPSEPTVVDVL